MAPWPHCAAHSTASLCWTLSQPCSFSLQSSKVVQGLTGLRNLGNTVSANPGTQLGAPSHTRPSAGTSMGQRGALSLCLTPQHPHSHPGVSLRPNPNGAS